MTTLQYNLIAYTPERVANIAEALPYANRKAILRTNLVLIAGLAVFYMYLSGVIVTGSAAKVTKTKELQSASRELDSARAELLSEGAGFSMGFFEEQGYYETKNLNVIKRTENVAAKEEFSTYQ